MNEGKLTEFQKIKLPKGKAKVVKTSNGWELLINNGKTTFTLDLGNKDRKFRFKGNKLNTTEKDAINFSKKLMKHSDFKGLKLIEGKLTEGFKKIAKKNVHKDKTGTYNWSIESGIDTYVMGGNTPKIILHYQHEDEEVSHQQVVIFLVKT